jgi:hypothetical protein
MKAVYAEAAGFLGLFIRSLFNVDFSNIIITRTLTISSNLEMFSYISQQKNNYRINEDCFSGLCVGQQVCVGPRFAFKKLTKNLTRSYWKILIVIRHVKFTEYIFEEGVPKLLSYLNVLVFVN